MSSTICTYILKKGKNKGESCGLKSFNNTQLCKKHSIDIIDENEVISQISNQELSDSKPKQPKENKEKQPKENKEKQSKEKKEKQPKENKEKQSKEKKEKQPKENKEKQPKENKEKQPKEIKEVSEKLNVFNKQKIQAKRNSYNNYVLSNDLVVHPVNKNIVGRQQGDKIIELSIEDIEYCKEHGFRYLQPSVMYFADSEVEKKEVELHKIMIKSQNKNNENSEDDLDENEEDENEEEGDNDNEENDEN